MVSLNKTLALTLTTALAGASSIPNKGDFVKRDSNLSISTDSFLQISNPIGIQVKLINDFLQKQQRVSDVIFGSDGEHFNVGVYGSLVIDVGLDSFKLYNNLDIVSQIIINTQKSNPGLIKQFAEDLGVFVNGLVANGEVFAQNLASYISALIQVIGSNDFSGISSVSVFFEDELKKKAESLGLTIKFVGEASTNIKNELILVKDFKCKVVKLFLSSIESVIKCEISSFKDIFGIAKKVKKIVNKVCPSSSGSTTSSSKPAG